MLISVLYRNTSICIHKCMLRPREVTTALRDALCLLVSRARVRMALHRIVY